jgi:hypothetical protein
MMADIAQVSQSRFDRRRIKYDADVVVKLLCDGGDKSGQVVFLSNRDNTGQVNWPARDWTSSSTSSHDFGVWNPGKLED